MGRTRESANLVSDKNIFVDIANDLVGIGTTAPTATLEVSGTLNVSGISTFQNNVDLGDDDRLRFGAGNDLQIYHDGSNSSITNDTGTLFIDQLVNDNDLNIRCDNGSGGTTTYVQCDGSSGAVNLYHYGTLKFETKSDGIDVTGEVQCDSPMLTNLLILLVTLLFTLILTYRTVTGCNLNPSDDLQIYHDGSNSYISEGGTGVLKVSSNRTEILSGSGEICAHFQGSLDQ